MSSITPYMARNTSIMAPLPTLNAGLRKYRMSSMGDFVWSSQSTKSVSTTTAVANAAIVTGATQPLSGASMKP